MGKFLGGMIVTAVLIILIVALVGSSQPSGANEIEAMARYEMIRGQNQVNLTYARADVFNQQVVLLSTVFCFGIVIILAIIGAFFAFVFVFSGNEIDDYPRDQHTSIGIY